MFTAFAKEMNLWNMKMHLKKEKKPVKLVFKLHIYLKLDALRLNWKYWYVFPGIPKFSL